MSDDKNPEAAPKKKGKLGKVVIFGLGGLALAGGGAGAGLYAAGSIGAKSAVADNVPHLVPKKDEKRAAAPAGGEGDAASGNHGGLATPAGKDGDRYASNYYALDKDFTANLEDSVHFLQVGIAISTPYDERVIDNIKTHEVAVRSAILMSLGETSEDQVFTAEGKRQLQARLVGAINDTLKQKEGFGGVGNVYFTNFVVQ